MPEGLPINPNKKQEGINHIMVCIEVSPNPDKSLKEFVEQRRKNKETNHISYYADSLDLNKQNFLNGGNKTYVISTVDSSDKFSSTFRNCTGLLVSGIDKKTGKKISFLSHQEPTTVLTYKKEMFKKHLKDRLDEVKDRCNPGTIDALIIGGNYDSSNSSSFFTKGYFGTLQLLSNEVKNSLGFDPVVVNGAKRVDGEDVGVYEDSVYLDTENSRAYLFRPKVDYNSRDFSTENIPINFKPKEKKPFLQFLRKRS